MPGTMLGTFLQVLQKFPFHMQKDKDSKWKKQHLLFHLFQNTFALTFPPYTQISIQKVKY